MSSLAPRVVLVSRESEYDNLLAAHGTRGQAAFFLEARDQSLDVLEERHHQQVETINQAKRSVPDDWSLTHAARKDLDRFLFMPNDIVVAVGQDGLVANLAKYVSEQPIVGVTTNPDRTEGILTPLTAGILQELLPSVASGETRIEKRSMVEAQLGNSQMLYALNELFIGHRSHQSARYVLEFDGIEEFQSSSGVIVATGTGLTGWAKSILTTTHRDISFDAEDRHAVFLAREPWPSRISGCELSFGEISAGRTLSITSRMNDGGVIFADGIEQDFLKFDWGVEAIFAVSGKTLNLVQG